MITYSTNWMGPVDLGWYEKNGVDYEEVKYSGGRIDIRDDTKEGYAGWHEYSLPIMRSEDWNLFSDWLDDFQTKELWSLKDILQKYEQDTNNTITWWKDL